MIVSLEAKKLRRTGYFPALLFGAALTAAFPFVHMCIRSDTFTAQPGDPFRILTDANWQFMMMLNLFLIICGTCMMYYTEFADNGAQKMETLPIRTGSLFSGKLVITAISVAGMLLLETAVLAFCCLHWFAGYTIRLPELAKNCGFAFAAALPTVILMLFLASVCKNMWVSFGIGLILMFTLSIFPKDSLVLSLCPFNSPYITLAELTEAGTEWTFLSVCVAESVLFVIAKLLALKLRRCFS
ncbi:MAG: ABC transporter permease [Eubacterium sp.]|nr:ABC transporter permease [Eubacterium sp.]